MNLQATDPTDLELPQGTLRGIRLSMRHDAGADAEDAVARLLSPLAGQGRVVHYQLVRRGLAWNKTRWRMLATANKRSLKLRSPQMRSSQLQAVVEALSALPGAREVVVKTGS